MIFTIFTSSNKYYKADVSVCFITTYVDTQYLQFHGTYK